MDQQTQWGAGRLQIAEQEGAYAWREQCFRAWIWEIDNFDKSIVGQVVGDRQPMLRILIDSLCISLSRTSSPS